MGEGSSDERSGMQSAIGRSGFRRLVSVGTLLAGVTLIAAACGGAAGPGVASVNSNTTSTSSVPAGGSGSPSPAVAKAQLAFSQCVRTHGLPNFPDPLPSGGFPRPKTGAIDFKSPQFLAAEKACMKYAIAGQLLLTPAEKAQHLRQLTAEDACMRKHGVPNMPDPTASGAQSFAPGITPNSPQFQRAERACAYLNP